MAEVLTHYPPSAQPLATPTEMANSGGLSGAKLWAYHAPAGPLIVRKWPINGPKLATIAQIHRWLDRARKLRFVPVPLAAKDGHSIRPCRGSLWSVEPFQPGLPVPCPLPPQVASAFAALARFHCAMGSITPSAQSPGLAARLQELESLVVHDLQAWRVAITCVREDPHAAAALRWIDEAFNHAAAMREKVRNAALHRVAIQPVIRDARPEHVLFSGDHVTGWVDFGAMGVDAVETDLARLMGEWFEPGAPEREIALSAYQAERAITPAEAALIEAFEQANDLLAGARWIRWHFVERIRFDDPNAVSVGLAKALKRVNRLGRPGVIRTATGSVSLLENSED
jgi:homoserine kinase type II